jgi:hypothetical protein
MTRMFFILYCARLGNSWVSIMFLILGENLFCSKVRDWVRLLTMRVYCCFHQKGGRPIWVACLPFEKLLRPVFVFYEACTFVGIENWPRAIWDRDISYERDLPECSRTFNLYWVIKTWMQLVLEALEGLIRDDKNEIYVYIQWWVLVKRKEMVTKDHFFWRSLCLKKKKHFSMYTRILWRIIT